MGKSKFKKSRNVKSADSNLAKSSRIRSFGKILLDMEILLDEMVDDHDVQLGDLLGLVNSWAQVHRPDCIEEYIEGGRPAHFYGPAEELK
jgi:hypothetical protein